MTNRLNRRSSDSTGINWPFVVTWLTAIAAWTYFGMFLGRLL